MSAKADLLHPLLYSFVDGDKSWRLHITLKGLKISTLKSAGIVSRDPVNVEYWVEA